MRVRMTTVYRDWIDGLRDHVARARIQVRVDRLVHGNPGAHRVLREGVSELKIDVGPGYRVYFTERGGELIILLAGGDKATQRRDIEHASSLPGTCPSRQSSTTMPRTTRTNTTRSSTKARPAGRTRTVAYDVAKQLRTPKEMAAYLEAWLVEAPDDAVGIARALGDIARAVGMSKVARQSGLSRESLYKALSEDGNPSLDTILRVARAVGVRFHASAA